MENKSSGPKKIIASGKELRRLLKESGESVLGLERKTKINENRIRGILNYYSYALESDVLTLCEFFKVSPEIFEPTEEEVARVIKTIAEKANHEKQRYKKNVLSNTKKKLKEKEPEPSILPPEGRPLYGLLFFLDKNGIDLGALSYLTRIDIDRLLEIQMFYNCQEAEFKNIATSLGLGVENAKRELLELPSNLPECPPKEAVFLIDYARDIQADSPKKATFDYFWYRACLADDRKKIYLCPYPANDQDEKF